MRASFSDLPDRTVRRWPQVIAAVYLLAHLPLLARSLEDIDSINFALGLRQFDVALHQPHPPGYPVYIALGRLSLWCLSVVARWSPARLDATALAIWSAVATVSLPTNTLNVSIPGATNSSKRFYRVRQ